MRGEVRKWSPSVTTDGLGSAPCIKLPSDQKLPLALTFGPPCMNTYTQTHTIGSIQILIPMDQIFATVTPVFAFYLNAQNFKISDAKIKFHSIQ